MLGRGIAALAVAAGIVAMGTPAAQAAPNILNDGGMFGAEAQWAESNGATHDTSNRRIHTTFLVQHDPGRRINRVVASNGTNTVTAQYLGTAGSSSGTNKLATSLVRFSYDPGDPAGWECPNIFGTPVRRRDVSLSFRVLDDLGASSETVSQTVKFVRTDQCGGHDDFPVLESVGQSATNISTNNTVNFSFRCDDADATGSNDRCDYIRWRTRRLNDGVVSGTTNQDAEDNTNRNFNVTFGSRGIYVVEAQLCGEDSCQDTSWWRLGSVLVNGSSAPSGNIAFPGAQGSGPPSVNQGTATNAVANVSDGDGIVQVLEWDAAGDGTFERTEFSVPLDAGDISPQSLTSAELQQAVDTSSHGLKTVQARATDNGAMDAADDLRRSVTVSAQLRVNAIPTATGGSRTIAEDSGPGSFQLSASDADNQPQALIYHVVSNPSKGSLSCSDSGACTYTPNPNATGTDSFSFRARDGGPGVNAAWSYSDTATYTINITAVNDAPALGDVSVFTNEDTPVGTTVSAVDPDGPALSYSVTGQPGNGTATCTSTGECSYTPAPDFFGEDSYAVSVQDGAGGSDTGTVTVNVAPVNDPPVAGDLSLTTAEDQEVTFGLPASDVEGATLDVTITDGPAHGSLTCDATCTYEPAPDYFGPDSFTYVVTDDEGASDTGSVQITVEPVNDAPVAEDVDASTDEDAPVAVLIPATDVDDEVLTYEVVQAPANGTVSCSGAVCTYSPNADYFGGDTFTVRVSDGPGLDDDAIVTVTINAVNDAPVAADAAIETLEDSPVTFAVPASDVDDTTLQITSTDGAHGDVDCGAATCTYTPELNHNGSDEFTYTASDGELSDSGTVTVTIAAVNDAPVADDDSIGTDEDTPVSVELTASDVDDDALTFAVGDAPAHGEVACDSAGACTYTPAQDFHGQDEFTFSASDGELSDSGKVTVEVAPVNDAPVAADAAIETLEDAAVTFAVPATDVDGTTPEITATDPSHGTVECSGALCTYTPEADYNAGDSFTYTASDGELSDTGLVTVTIAAVNDAPVADDRSASTDEDTAQSIQLGATDVDGDVLTYSVGDAPAHGTVECGPTGACTYTPAPDFNGPDEFTFTASDGELNDSGTVTIDVQPVNDAPVAQNASAATNEDTPVDVTIPATDVDGDALAATASDPAHGRASCEGLVCTYEPDANYNGGDAFVATVSDASGATATSIVTIAVAPVNDAPVPDDISVFADEDGSVQFALGGSDVEGDALTFAVKPGTGPEHGDVVCDAGNCLYVADANYNGADAFDFTANDGNGGISTGTVSITVRPVNDAPSAPDGSASVDEDETVAITLLATDIDGDELTYEHTGAGPAHGSVSCTSAGVCTYEPAADYNGEDAFAYRATDPAGASATGTVEITVNPVNDAPTAEDIEATTEEDTSMTIALKGADVDGDLLDYENTSPSHGTLACEDALCEYTPGADYFGEDSFTYTVTDPSGASASATVTILVSEIRHQTTIIAGPVVTSLDPLRVNVSYRAQLLRTSDSAPVVDRLVTFVTGGQHTCSARTGGDGYAYCPWSISRSAAVLLDLGYDAVFEGDADYMPVSGHGGIVG